MSPPRVADPPLATALEQRVLAAERILRIFLPERIGYLVVSILSCVTLLVVIWRLISAGTAGTAELVLMFGSTGLITVSAVRVLRMFHDVMAFVQRHRPVSEEAADDRD